MIDKLTSFMRLDRSVQLFMFACLLHGFGGLGIYLMLLNFYLASLSFDMVFIGNINGISGLVTALSAIPAGLIGARLGLRGTTVAGYGICALGVTLFLLTAPLLPEAWCPASLTTALVVFAFGGGLILVNYTPYLMGIAPEDQRDMAFTLMGVVFALGALVGNLVAGFLPGLLIRIGSGAISQSMAFNLVIWLFVPSFLACMLILLLARPAPSLLQKSQGDARGKTPYGLLAFLGVLMTLFMFGEGGFSTFINLFLAEELALSTGLIGSVFAAGKVITILAAPLLLLGLKRLGSGWTMNWSYAVISLCALLLILLPIPLVAVTATVLYGPLSNFCVSARTLFSQYIVIPRWRTMTSAVLIVSQAIGWGGAGLIGGRIIASSGYTVLFFLSAGVILSGFLLYMLYHRTSTKAHPHVKVAAPTV